MAGAVDALELGTALFDEDEVILAVCQRFASLCGRGSMKIIGLHLVDLIRPADRAASRYLLRQFWKERAPFTFVAPTRRPDKADFLVESRVFPMTGSNRLLSLVAFRPFSPRTGQRSPIGKTEGAADYVVDMAMQMAELAAAASLPITSDLLGIAAKVGVEEAGLEAIVETSA